MRNDLARLAMYFVIVTGYVHLGGTLLIGALEPSYDPTCMPTWMLSDPEMVYAGAAQATLVGAALILALAAMLSPRGRLVTLLSGAGFLVATFNPVSPDDAVIGLASQIHLAGVVLALLPPFILGVVSDDLVLRICAGFGLAFMLAYLGLDSSDKTGVWQRLSVALALGIIARQMMIDPNAQELR